MTLNLFYSIQSFHAVRTIYSEHIVLKVNESTAWVAVDFGLSCYNCHTQVSEFTLNTSFLLYSGWQDYPQGKCDTLCEFIPGPTTHNHLHYAHTLKLNSELPIHLICMFGAVRGTCREPQHLKVPGLERTSNLLAVTTKPLCRPMINTTEIIRADYSLQNIFMRYACLDTLHLIPRNKVYESVTGPPAAAAWTCWSHPVGWWWAYNAVSDRDSWSAPGTRPMPGSRR